MITLTVGSTTQTLPRDLRWTDELDWSGVKQNVDNTITGGIIVESAAILAGRPITLAPVGEDSAWITLETLRAVKAWANIPGQQMTLSFNGTEYNVMFRHQDNDGLTSNPIVFYSDPANTDFFTATFKFMEVPTT